MGQALRSRAWSPQGCSAASLGHKGRLQEGLVCPILLSRATLCEWTGHSEHSWPCRVLCFLMLPRQLAHSAAGRRGLASPLDAGAGLLLRPRGQSDTAGTRAQPHRALGAMAKVLPKDWSLGRESRWGGRGWSQAAGCWLPVHRWGLHRRERASVGAPGHECGCVSNLGGDGAHPRVIEHRYLTLPSRWW